MAVNRKGVVFTLIALILAAFILGMQGRESALDPTGVDTLAARSRVNALNAYLSTFEEQVSHSLATSGYFALKNISRKVGSERRFIADINATLRQCLLQDNLTIRGAGVARLPCLHGNFTLDASLGNLTALALSNMSIVTAYEFHDAWVTEERPAEVVLWLNLSYNITDGISEPFARWNVRGKVVRAAVSAEGVEDPVYLYLNGSGFTREQRTFALTDIKPHDFTPATFGSFYGNRSYTILEGRAPSVLQRYAGDTVSTSACCGIESVMVRAQLTNTNATYQNLSMIDHHLAANKQGLLGAFSCDRTVEAIAVAGGKLVIEKTQYDNRYNLTDSPAAVSACGWP